MSDYANEILENVLEIDNPSAYELTPGDEWRICPDCEQLFTAPKNSVRHYCPVCAGLRRIESGRKGGQATRTKPFETCLIKKKENIKMPIETKASEAPNAEHIHMTAPAVKTVSAGTLTMRQLATAYETLEGFAGEWGTDIDTVIDTMTEIVGIVRAVKIKSRTKVGAAE